VPHSIAFCAIEWGYHLCAIYENEWEIVESQAGTENYAVSCTDLQEMLGSSIPHSFCKERK